MSTALVPASPPLADVLAAHPGAETELAELFVDIYVEMRARDAANAEGADASARAAAAAELYEHETFADFTDDALPEFPADVLDAWLATEPELDFRVARERAENAVADRVEAYTDLRADGKTVVQAARKLGEDPGRLVALADAKLDPHQRERIKAGRAARREDDAARAFNGRRRLLSALASKLTKEIETRDMSDVPADKLVGMLLKVCELSREEAPETTVHGRIQSV